MEKVKKPELKLVKLEPASHDNSDGECPRCGHQLSVIHKIKRLAWAALGQRDTDLGGTATPRGVAEGR